MPIKAALFYDYPSSHGEVFGDGRRERIAALTKLYPEVVNAANFERHAAHLAEIEVIFATWGMPHLSAAQLACMPVCTRSAVGAGFQVRLPHHDPRILQNPCGSWVPLVFWSHRRTGRWRATLGRHAAPGIEPCRPRSRFACPVAISDSPGVPRRSGSFGFPSTSIPSRRHLRCP
jgi:hypothetical protein